MSRKTAYALAILGIALSCALLFLRVNSALSSGLGMFTHLLGYEQPQTYAFLLFDPSKEPVLFVATVSKGDITFTSVGLASDIVRDLDRSKFPNAADTIIQRLADSKSIQVDAVGFITTDAVGEFVDAYGDITLQEKKITSENIGAVISTLVASDDAVRELHSSLSFPKRNIITQSQTLLRTAKHIFATHRAAVYLKHERIFGKSCVGACNEELFEYLGTSGILNR